MSPRGFTSSESELIRARLIEACRECWERYGFQKTTVAELARSAGISTGAFYGFFTSKALLFAETAIFYAEQIADNFKRSLPEDATKENLATAIKGMVRDFAERPWLISGDGGLEMMRQLPPGEAERLRGLDLSFVREVLEQHHLVCTVSVEEFTAIIYALCLSENVHDVVGEHYLTALDILVDGAVDRVIEPVIRKDPA